MQFFSFHPRLGIVTQTVAGAKLDIQFFIVVVVVLGCIYSTVAVFLYHPYASAFRQMRKYPSLLRIDDSD